MAQDDKENTSETSEKIEEGKEEILTLKQELPLPKQKNRRDSGKQGRRDSGNNGRRD